jgi:hypothetical protein
MSRTEADCGRVVGVLLADGWHQIVPGSFTVGPLDLGGYTDQARLGFRFLQTRAGSPHPPGVLAGPLDSIIAIRQAAPARTPGGHGAMTPVVLNGRRPGLGTRQAALAVR